MTLLTRYITNQDQIELSTKTYCSKYRYNIDKDINTNSYVTFTQWQNKSYIGEIWEKNTQDEVQLPIRFCKIHKHINVGIVT